MARESISKIAYKTLQQSKSIAGFAHKQISSCLLYTSPSPRDS